MADANQPTEHLNAQAAAATLPLAQPQAQAAAGAPDVPTPAGAEECTLKIPGGIDREIPEVLVWTGKCRTADQYIGLVKSAYKLVQIKRVTLNGAERNCLNFRFIGVENPQILAGIRASTPDLANVTANVIGLNGLLTTIVSGATSYSSLRQVAPSCTEGFTNANVNNELVELCQQEDDDKTAPDYLYTLLVNRFIPLCKKSILFLHKKARLGVEFFYEIEHLKQDIAKLKNDYHLMLTSLRNRATVNNLLFHVMTTKKKAMEDLKKYTSFWDEESFNHCKSIFEQKLDVYNEVVFFDETDAPGDNNLTSWVTEKTIYSHLVKAPDVKPETLSIFKGITEDIDPIISGIRTFTPTPLELAQEKAVFMKTSMTRIRKESEVFLKPESEKTIGKAKSLLEQIKSIRGAIDNLQMSGLVVNHNTVGITQDELEEFYVKISNTLAQKEYEVKVNEAKQRAANNELAKGAPQLQLPPLNGFSSWLNFRKAINDIMPLHSNHLIKKQILLKSLKNKEDLLRCQSLDYEDGFKYLVQRYESSALIPGLIDELLKLTPASSDKQAYENLTQLISTTSMLQSYQQMDKLDSNCRSKLVFILLHREFQLDFLKEQVIYEESIKKEVAEDRMLDGISEITCLQTAEVEAKRRTWWLEQMGRYLIVARELTKTLKEKKEKSQSLAFSTGSEDVVDPPVETVEACPVCNDVHLVMGKCMVSLAKCPIFTNKDYSVEKRREVVKRYNFCIRCLWKNNNPRCANCTPIPHWLLKEKYQDSAESNEEDSEADNHDSEKSKSNSEQSGEEDEE